MPLHSITGKGISQLVGDAAWQELQQEIDSFGGQKDARLKAATAKLKAAKAAAEKARSALKAAEAALVAATAEGEAADGERAGLTEQLVSTKASVAGAVWNDEVNRAVISIVLRVPDDANLWIRHHSASQVRTVDWEVNPFYCTDVSYGLGQGETPSINTAVDGVGL